MKTTKVKLLHLVTVFNQFSRNFNDVHDYKHNFASTNRLVYILIVTPGHRSSHGPSCSFRSSLLGVPFSISEPTSSERP